MGPRKRGVGSGGHLEGLLGHGEQRGLHHVVAGGGAAGKGAHQALQQLLQRRQLRQQLRRGQVAHLPLRWWRPLRLLPHHRQCPITTSFNVDCCVRYVQSCTLVEFVSRSPIALYHIPIEDWTRPHKQIYCMWSIA